MYLLIYIIIIIIIIIIILFVSKDEKGKVLACSSSFERAGGASRRAVGEIARHFVW